MFAPRRLGFGDAAALDLEDIGRLLGVGRPTGAAQIAQARTGAQPIARVPTAACAPRGEASRVQGVVPSLVPSMAPNLVPRRAATLPPAAPEQVTAAHSDTGQPPLDPAQRAAAEHACGPARVLAPAGAGKTKTLIARVLQLIERGTDPSGILMLAFNRKAAEQLEERLAAQGVATTRRLGSPVDEASGHRTPGSTMLAPRGAAPPPPRPATVPALGVHVATFNAFGYRYQREMLAARFSLDLTGAELRALMRRAIEASGTSLADLRPARGSDPVGAFMKGLTRVRAALESPEEIEISLESTGEQPIVTLPFAPAHAQYTRAQAVTGHQSFDDQIYFAVADMLADPAHRAFIQGRFDHVLVDEFQDLNGAPARAGGHRLAAVAERVRGRRRRSAHHGLEVREADGHPRVRGAHAGCLAPISCRSNYRSSAPIVATSSRVIAHNHHRVAKDIKPRHGAPSGLVVYHASPSFDERSRAIVEFVRQRRKECENWRKIAVLCRYKAQQPLVAMALDAAGIPRTPLLSHRLLRTGTYSCFAHTST